LERSHELFVWTGLNCEPLNLSVPSSEDYKCEPPAPSSYEKI
jgi:hypothetical protein